MSLLCPNWGILRDCSLTFNPHTASFRFQYYGFQKGHFYMDSPPTTLHHFLPPSSLSCGLLYLGLPFPNLFPCFPGSYRRGVITYKIKFKLNYLSLKVFCDLIAYLPPLPFLFYYQLYSPRVLNTCNSRNTP